MTSESRNLRLGVSHGPGRLSPAHLNMGPGWAGRGGGGEGKPTAVISRADCQWQAEPAAKTDFRNLAAWPRRSGGGLVPRRRVLRQRPDP